jgi:hypothetical protein
MILSSEVRDAMRSIYLCRALRPRCLSFSGANEQIASGLVLVTTGYFTRPEPSITARRSDEIDHKRFDEPWNRFLDDDCSRHVGRQMEDDR